MIRIKWAGIVSTVPGAQSIGVERVLFSSCQVPSTHVSMTFSRSYDVTSQAVGAIGILKITIW